MRMSSHDYTFTDYWSIDSKQDFVWAALERYQDWSSWWGGLEKVEMLDEYIGVGTRFRCTWRGAAWYKLRLTLTITQYNHGKEITFDSEGDLVGQGDFKLYRHDRMAKMTINWHVRTVKWWMNVFGPLLRPVFIMNHAKIMNAGERGLQQYIGGQSHEKV
ncbi:MAG: hypothetical protein JWO07_264 [Candidatus Saccharibacteria bacterium]|nr:hypothetical protein [Candidatus Saccharibacteria bacterium]